jgi:hypothetical protein
MPSLQQVSGKRENSPRYRMRKKVVDSENFIDFNNFSIECLDSLSLTFINKFIIH